MPLTDAQVIAAFGDPAPHVGIDGVPRASWEISILQPLALPAPLPLSWSPTVRVRIMRVHRRLVGAFQRALAAVHADRAAWESIDDFGGVYQWRRMKGSRRLSRHSWAIAIDLDVADNGDGAAGEMYPGVIAAFEAEGFEWGGRWSRRERDPMHFEFVDLARLEAP